MTTAHRATRTHPCRSRQTGHNHRRDRDNGRLTGFILGAASVILAQYAVLFTGF
jgi:hypothetical protein